MKNRLRLLAKPVILVGGGGFEPPKSSTTDLQSAPFGRSGILPYVKVSKYVRMLLVGLQGLEPGTDRL